MTDHQYREEGNGAQPVHSHGVSAGADTRYLAIGLDNETKMYDFTLKRTPQDYTPSTLRQEGVR